MADFIDKSKFSLFMQDVKPSKKEEEYNWVEYNRDESFSYQSCEIKKADSSKVVTKYRKISV